MLRFSPDKLRSVMNGKKPMQILTSIPNLELKSHYTISNWLSGQSEPRATQLKAIADYIGVSMEYFFE